MEIWQKGLLIKSFLFEGRLRPLARPRMGKNRNAYSPLSSQAEFRNFLKGIQTFTIDEPFYLTCHIFLKSKKKHGGASDVDNLLKSVLDGLQYTQIVSDDRLCVGIHSTKNAGKTDVVVCDIHEAICQDIHLDLIS